MNEKNKVEAILFASGNFLSLDEISKLSGVSDLEQLRIILNEIKIDYEARGSSVTLIEDAGHYKLTVKDHYASILQKLVSKTELNKPLTETLAVIAWKYPVTQSEVIKIRHNKAYEHMRKLEELGFITKVKFGRTSKIILTEKFFEYFALPRKEKGALQETAPENIKEVIEKKEQEIKEAEKLIVELKEKEKEMEEQRRRIKEEEAKAAKTAETGENLEVSEEQLKAMDMDFEQKEFKKEIPELKINEDLAKFQESLIQKAKEKRKKKKTNKIESIKEELNELDKKEEKEVEKIEKDISELKKEEEVNVYAESKQKPEPNSSNTFEVSELQKPDEIPDQDSNTKKEE